MAFGLIAVSVAGVLALVTTWFLVAYFPDNDAIYAIAQSRRLGLENLTK